MKLKVTIELEIKDDELDVHDDFNDFNEFIQKHIATGIVEFAKTTKSNIIKAEVKELI